MEKTLKELQAQIEEAEALAKEYQEEYKQAALKAFDEGRLEEVLEAEWCEIHGDGYVKVYCTRCFSISPSGLKHDRCPACGARMRNARIVYKKVEKTPALVETLAKKVSQEKPLEVSSISDKTAGRPKDKATAPNIHGEVAKGIINAFMRKGVSQGKLAKISGCSQGAISQYHLGKIAPHKASYDKLCDAYRGYFGEDFSMGGGITNGK